MASGSYIQVYVLCPYYTSDNGKNRVDCEGIYDNSRIVQLFVDPKTWKFHMETYCCKHYKKCEICRILDEKYEE